MKTHLTFQEYFERMTRDTWNKPLSALLQLRAQMDLGIAAVGGKDMSGTFEPARAANAERFAIDVASTDDILSPEFKRGARVR